MPLHLLGVGSIGSLLAAHLKQHTGQTVNLIVRSRDLSRRLFKGFDDNRGITIERDGKQTQVNGFEVELIPKYRAYLSALQGNPNVDERAIERAKSEDEQQQRLGPITSLFVTTKAPAVVAALRQLLPRISPESTIVLLQNGGGLLDSVIKQVFPDETTRPNFIVGINSHGAYVKNTRTAEETSYYQRATHTVWAGTGDIKFGVLPNEAIRAAVTEAGHARSNVFEAGAPDRSLALKDLPGITAAKGLHSTLSAMLACEPLNFHWLPMQDIVQIQQQKLAINCVINPLTAIFDVQNGVLNNNKASRGISVSICQEVSSVFAEHARQTILEAESAKAAGQATAPALPYSLSDRDRSHLLEHRAFRDSHPLSAISLVYRCEDIMVSTDVNVSSTLADIRKGAFDTEIDFMNGYVSRLGRELDMPTPVNDMLVMMVRFKTGLGRRAQRQEVNVPRDLPNMRISERFGATYKPSGVKTRFMQKRKESYRSGLPTEVVPLDDPLLNLSDNLFNGLTLCGYDFDFDSAAESDHETTLRSDLTVDDPPNERTSTKET